MDVDPLTNTDPMESGPRNAQSLADDGPGEKEDSILEDELVLDPAGNEFTRKYSNLPRTFCPYTLNISTLRPKYLDSLYSTDRVSYLKNWYRMKIDDPVQAWHSLNQTMINFVNRRWGEQGIAVTPGEIVVDLYNLNELKSSIIRTIKESIQTPNSNQAGERSVSRQEVDKDQ